MTTRVEQKRSANVHTRHAPFALRCGALLLDYTLVVSLLAASTFVAQLLGGGARFFGSTIETFGYLLAIAAALLNFVVAAGLTGSTFGKWATGLRIERPDGESLGLWRAFLRHFIGYPISLLLLGGGFLLALLDPHGRALHDLIARTEVCIAPEYARRFNER
ncbi:RDD family protein [Pyrinomonas methylaliphatogenes]|jgi:uncharacterized RDD family membrane protein YckC|uniref:Predicted membrane protein/domain n=1 Tax=Pyrinomonas methylaliphatogenes TaxID=454194 RepID=A0A0B6X3M1_9BACT|nr:RDD family protein [Pyrinomonas methylaliphatogenes]MBX5477690.1 RDD family protein [Pyrinomonas methylaliphatogenes]CDM66900.1 predicted membrane protein/domain [Pyrinomonas methylaliphatogenes]